MSLSLTPVRELARQKMNEPSGEYRAGSKILDPQSISWKDNPWNHFFEWCHEMALHKINPMEWDNRNILVERFADLFVDDRARNMEQADIQRRTALLTFVDYRESTDELAFFDMQQRLKSGRAMIDVPLVMRLFIKMSLEFLNESGPPLFSRGVLVSSLLQPSELILEKLATPVYLGLTLFQFVIDPTPHFNIQPIYNLLENSPFVYLPRFKTDFPIQFRNRERPRSLVRQVMEPIVLKTEEARVAAIDFIKDVQKANLGVVEEEIAEQERLQTTLRETIYNKTSAVVTPIVNAAGYIYEGVKATAIGGAALYLFLALIPLLVAIIQKF